MKSISHKDLSLSEYGGISNLWRKGCAEAPYESVFSGLRDILKQLDCVNIFIKEGYVTTYIRKKIHLVLELPDGSLREGDAYLRTNSLSIVFFPKKLETFFKQSVWYRVEGILIDQKHVLKTAQQLKELEEDLFPTG